MHELSVVFHCIKEIKDIAKENKVTSIKGVSIEIGEVSMVIPDMFVDCWNWAIKKEDLLKESKLKVEIIKGVTHCESCNKDYDTVTYAKVCPYCGSNKTYLITGNEIVIKELAVD